MSFLTKTTQIIASHKPEIFIGLGIVLGAGCVATTVVQTIKACDIIENANAAMDAAEADVNSTDDEKALSCRSIRKKTNLKLAKNYLAPVALGAGSIACTLAAYKILSNEKAAAVAALSATTAAFEKYRSRVIEKYGAEVDYELYNGIERSTVVDENGNEVSVTKIDPIDGNCYTKIFSYETSSEWKRTRRLNIAILEYYERYWNDQLRKKGYVTYNEVIESLGFSRKVGSDMTEKFIPNGIGWVSDDIIPGNLSGQYDTFISFVPNETGDAEELDRLYNYGDLGYVLRFNCYPIDNLLANKAEAVRNGEH